ncbi:hypothetical protein D3C76_1811110 [compost metagenome]
MGVFAQHFNPCCAWGQRYRLANGPQGAGHNANDANRYGVMRDIAASYFPRHRCTIGPRAFIRGIEKGAQFVFIWPTY